MSNLQSAIESQVSTAADSIAAAIIPGIVEALKAATMEQIFEFMKGGVVRTPAKKVDGRSNRRSGDDIGKALGDIVGLLGSNPDGLGAETIRDRLGMDKKDIARPIAMGLGNGELTKTGEKRSTKYYAVPKGAEAPPVHRGMKKKKASSARSK